MFLNSCTVFQITIRIFEVTVPLKYFGLALTCHLGPDQRGAIFFFFVNLDALELKNVGMSCQSMREIYVSSQILREEYFTST